jgi:phosphomevalonate kinase
MALLNKPLTIKVPGKLMIAGEFAVLEPYQKLVVMAVDRFVYATIEHSQENLLTLENFSLHNLYWNYQNEEISIDSTDHRINFVEQAMLITCRYLQEQSITLKPFTLNIKSELDDRSGIKYGLGSSAAVVTAVITAILNLHLTERPSPILIFKLAAISHVETQGNGSGADIAASTYGGILQYSSFQAEWLLTELKNHHTLTSLIERDWTYLSIEQIEFPRDLSMCIGWTGQPASTAKLVDKILALKEESPGQFRQFLLDSKVAVDTILESVENKSKAGLLEGIKQNRRCLATLGENADVEIETLLLKKLADITEQYGGAGKLSGAGGGDCGIAFLPSIEKANQLLEAWENAGIKPLTIKEYLQGADVV